MKRQPKVDVGAVERTDLRKAIYPAELRGFKNRLHPGKIVWIPEKDDDGNIAHIYATIEKKYSNTVLLNYTRVQKYTGGKVRCRMSPSYIQLLLMLGRGTV